MAALPVFKLGMLAVKSLSKPISKQMKESSKTHPLLRSVCLFTGNTWHSLSVRLNVSLLGHKIKEIKPLPEDQAISQGAEFVCEFFVYTVAAGTVIAEVIRNNNKSEQEKIKKKERQDEKHRLMNEQIGSIISRIDHVQQEVLLEIQVLKEENVRLRQDIEGLKHNQGILSWLHL